MQRGPTHSLAPQAVEMDCSGDAVPWEEPADLLKGLTIVTGGDAALVEFDWSPSSTTRLLTRYFWPVSRSRQLIMRRAG